MPTEKSRSLPDRCVLFYFTVKNSNCVLQTKTEGKGKSLRLLPGKEIFVVLDVREILRSFT